MLRSRSTVAVCLLPLLAGCASAPAVGSERASAGAPAAPAEPTPRANDARTGVVVPIEPASIRPWPEAYSGELVLLEVLPHGAEVAEGGVVAELDPRALDRELADAALELASARVRDEGLVRRHAVEEAAARSQLAQAESALDRARRALAGWKERELAFSERQAQLQRRYEAANVEDQQDELAQLQAMYQADELTDATEQIVLKRSQRALAITEVGNALARDRREYQRTLQEKLELESREEAVRVQEQALARTVETQAIERAAREDAAARSKAELAQKAARHERLARDRASLTLRAPRSGVLLHGSLESLRSGAQVRHERGGSLAARKDAFLVADPARAAVALDLPESAAGSLRSGARVRVRPLALPGAAIEGTVEIASWPGPRAAGDELARAATIVLEDAPRELRFGGKARVEVEPSAGSGP